jgi:DNA-binding IclR family transcriptional regulator
MLKQGPESMGTVSKALSLIGFFDRSHARIGLSELTRMSGMNKATVHRLMTELAEHGYVEQVGSNREYQLGPVFLRLAALREAAVPTLELTGQVLKRLADATGETAHMSRVQGNILATVDYTYSPAHGTRVAMEDAEIVTFHGTASGLAVLAYSAPDFVDTVLAGDLPARTDETVTDPAEIRKMLVQTRLSGIATYVGGFEKDVHSHACPIFDSKQKVIGAVAVAAPTVRMDDQRIAAIRLEVKRHALELTRLLGGFPADDYDRTLPADASEKDGE